MRIRAHQRVGISDLDVDGLAARGRKLFFARPHRLRQIFEIDLMADAGARRHDAEIVERALAPFQEDVTLGVALIFKIDVLLERLRRAELIDDHGMVDHEIDRHERVDLVGIAAQFRHRVAHGGQIDDSGNAGEILHQHTGWTEGDFLLGLALVIEPFGNGDDIFLRDGAPVFETQQVLKQNLHGERQLRNALEAVLLRLLQREVMVGLGADGQFFAAFEAVERGHGFVPGS